jgi:LPXTG-motif cell wall-anchored protein
MTTPGIRGMRHWPLPALLLLALLGAPILAMADDGIGPPLTSTREIEQAQSVLLEEHYLRAGRFEPGRLDQSTIDALRTFERAHFIRETGSLDRDTVAALTSHRAYDFTASPTNTGSTQSATGAGAADNRKMPVTAGPVPLMSALGVLLLGGGFLLARRRRV